MFAANAALNNVQSFEIGPRDGIEDVHESKICWPRVTHRHCVVFVKKILNMIFFFLSLIVHNAIDSNFLMV